MTNGNGNDSNEEVLSPGAPGQAKVVQLLERILADAKRGKFTTFAFVGLDAHSQITNGFAGPQIGDVYVGIALLQQQLLHQIRNPQPTGGIVPVKGMPSAFPFKKG